MFCLSLPRVFAIGFLLFLSLSLEADSSTGASAATGGGLILKNANSMLRDDSKNIIELAGSVELIFKQQYLSADKVTVYLDKKQLEASGRVILASSSIYAEAEKLFFNYRSNQGVMYRGFVQSGKTLFTGEAIYKTSEDTYEVKDSEYTTCTNCRPSWSFTGSEIEAKFGDSAKIKNALLRVKGLPILWFPYFLVPLRNERQSGLLAPVFESSRNGGFTFGLTYFDVLSDSTDAEYTLTSFETRGLKYAYQYRYALSPTDRGELRFSYIRDQFFGSDYVRFNPQHDGSPIERWYLNYHQRFQLPQGYVQRTNLFFVSDSQYPFDFIRDIPLEGFAAIQNRVSVSKGGERDSGYIELVTNENLLNTDPLEDNTDSVHRFPEIRLHSHLQEIPNTPLYFRQNLHITNFARPDRAYVNRSSSFSSELYDAGIDVIRAGQRLIYSPSLYYPMQLGDSLDLLPSVKLQSNFYQFGVPISTPEYVVGQNPEALVEGNTTAQHRLEINLDMQTRFHRVYGAEQDIAYKHEIIPSLTYTQTPFIRRLEHSFFDGNPQDFLAGSLGIADSDNIQFDYDDQVIDQRSIRVGIQNYVKKRLRHADGSQSYQTPLFWNVYQSYDFKLGNEPLSDLTSILNWRFHHFELGTELHYFPYRKVTNSNIRLRYSAFSDSFFEVAYDTRYEVRINQELDRSTKTENLRPSFYYAGDVVSFGGAADFSVVTDEWRSLRLGMMLQPPGDCWRIGFTHFRPFIGEQVTKAVFEWFFDGQKWSGDNLRERIF